MTRAPIYLQLGAPGSVADHGRRQDRATARGHVVQDHPPADQPGVSRPTAAILLTGSELLRGVISDLNAAHLARRLEAIGFDMQRTLLVGDPIEQIEQGVRELTGSHDLVVTSGGLGPTHDDRTVEALANVAGRPLEVDEGVLAQITSWTDGVADRMGFPRGRFEAGNRKQARIPQGRLGAGAGRHRAGAGDGGGRLGGGGAAGRALGASAAVGDGPGAPRSGRADAARRSPASAG